MALWDIVGQACKQPLYKGGEYRDEVKFWGWVTKLPGIAAAAKFRVRQGYDTFYEKVGIDPAHNIACVKAIREVVGTTSH